MSKQYRINDMRKMETSMNQDFDGLGNPQK